MPHAATSTLSPRRTAAWRCVPGVLFAACGLQAVAQVPDTMDQRMRACVGCHGREGRATPEGYFPRIAGKPPQYLYNQLAGFRDGRRRNATMTYLLEYLSDAYLHEIAGHFAKLDLPYAPPPPAQAPAPVLQRGEQLARQGDRSRDLPACSSCHAATLTGTLPAVPGLLGLPRDYLIAQFGSWRTGQRKTAAPDCMATIAQRLSPDDVAAVASWLAAQPVPPGPQGHAPVAPDFVGPPAPPAPLPLPCGSVPP